MTENTGAGGRCRWFGNETPRRSTGNATLPIFTEQGVFLDGGERMEHREPGTGILLDSLGAALEAETATE